MKTDLTGKGCSEDSEGCSKDVIDSSRRLFRPFMSLMTIIHCIILV